MDLDPISIARVVVCAFFAILFLQSGIDKVTDRAGNLGWMEPHFENSPFKGKVPILLTIITLFEVGSGLMCAAGVVTLLLQKAPIVPVAAMVAVNLTLLQLFMGQRLAKDYAGAASLAGYMAVSVIGLMLLPGLS